MSVVRPEYGPTLPELVRPHLERLPRRVVVAAAVVLAALVLAFAAFLLTRGTAMTGVVVREPIAFNFVYDPAKLRPAPPTGGLVAALQEAPGRPYSRMAVEPFDLPAYRGDSSAVLTSMSVGLIEEMRADDPSFVLRYEGRTRTNDAPGYLIAFQTRVGGSTAYGKRYLFVPGTEPAEAPRRGLDMTLLATRSPAIPNVDAIGVNGPLKTPLRSLRFGTERP